MAMFSKMISMARSTEEVKKEIDKYAGGPASIKDATVPTYPYGLCLSLDDESLNKLGLKGDLPDVGDMIHFCAMGRVTSASEREEGEADGDKKTCRRIELQITDMGMENEREESDGMRRENWYGAGKKDAAA